MTRNHGAGGNAPDAIGGWKGSLAAVLKAHNGARQDGAVASFATQDKRSDVLYAGFTSLRALGFRMDTVTGLRGKHIGALAKEWHARGLSASTLHNNLSIFRTFAEWIGKAGMVRDIEHYLGSGVSTRSSIAREDKSWSRRGVDVAAKIEQVRQKDARVALQLELQRTFACELGKLCSFARTLQTGGPTSASLTAPRVDGIGSSRSARLNNVHC